MPKESIKRAIDRVSDKNAAVLDEVVYEAYGPGGVGIIIEAATDNKNRTLAEIKQIRINMLHLFRYWHGMCGKEYRRMYLHPTERSDQ